MQKIFISYRRDDSAYVAGLLRDALEEHFGKGTVFLDIDSIPYGLDFRDRVSAALNECDVVLAIIGESWLSVKLGDGRRRIDSPTDHLRLEIETALSRGLALIPVLVDAASMPTKEDLPESIQSLVYRNAAEVRPGRDLKNHIRLLINGIEALRSELSRTTVQITQIAERCSEIVEPVKVETIATPNSLLLTQCVLIAVIFMLGIGTACKVQPISTFSAIVAIPLLLVTPIVARNKSDRSVTRRLVSFELVNLATWISYWLGSASQRRTEWFETLVGFAGVCSVYGVFAAIFILSTRMGIAAQQSSELGRHSKPEKE